MKISEIKQPIKAFETTNGNLVFMTVAEINLVLKNYVPVTNLMQKAENENENDFDVNIGSDTYKVLTEKYGKVENVITFPVGSVVYTMFYIKLSTELYIINARNRGNISELENEVKSLNKQLSRTGTIKNSLITNEIESLKQEFLNKDNFINSLQNKVSELENDMLISLQEINELETDVINTNMCYNKLVDKLINK